MFIGLTSMESAPSVFQPLPRLGKAGVRLVDWESLDEADRAWIERGFVDRIFPSVAKKCPHPTNERALSKRAAGHYFIVPLGYETTSIISTTTLANQLHADAAGSW